MLLGHRESIIIGSILTEVLRAGEMTKEVFDSWAINEVGLLPEELDELYRNKIIATNYFA